MNRLHPHNIAKQRDQAPAVVEADLYLDELQAKGHAVRIWIAVGTEKVSGETILEAVKKLRARRKQK